LSGIHNWLSSYVRKGNMPTQDLLDIEVTEDIAGDLASSGLLDETSEAADAEVYAGSRDDGLEEMVASEISVQTPRNKVAIDKAAELLSPASIPVDKTAALLSPSSIPSQSPLGVSSRWQLSTLDLKHRVLPEEPDLFAPRLSPTTKYGSPQPGSILHDSRAAVAIAPDPLIDVLDWLGRQNLASDHEFISDVYPRGAEDEHHTDAEAFPHAREPFTDYMDVPDETGRVRQKPRSREPKRNTLLDMPLPQNCAGISSVCLMMMQEALQEAPQQLTYADEEEMEWAMRKKRTGPVGRLVVYAIDDDPRDDLLLRGGSDRPFVVAALADGGPAARAGVKAGDRLVSINGKKDFVGMTLENLREHLRPPVMLVFLGFVGKLQAEVRLTCTDRVAGLPVRYEVARGYSDAPLQVCEERVFNAGFASLFLAVAESHQPSVWEQGTQSAWQKSLALTPMFELQRAEASTLVRSALHGGAAVAGVGAGCTREDVMAIAPLKPPGDLGCPAWEGDHQTRVCDSRVLTNVPRAAPMLTQRRQMSLMRNDMRSSTSERYQPLRSFGGPRTRLELRNPGGPPTGPRALDKQTPCANPDSICTEPAFN
jgi:hypothetical protein